MASRIVASVTHCGDEAPGVYGEVADDVVWVVVYRVLDEETVVESNLCYSACFGQCSELLVCEVSSVVA